MGSSSDVHIKKCMPTCPRPSPEHVLAPKDPGLTQGRLQLQREDAAQRCLQRQDVGAERLQLSIRIHPTGPSTFLPTLQRDSLMATVMMRMGI